MECGVRAFNWDIFAVTEVMSVFPLYHTVYAGLAAAGVAVALALTLTLQSSSASPCASGGPGVSAAIVVFGCGWACTLALWAVVMRWAEHRFVGATARLTLLSATRPLVAVVCGDDTQRSQILWALQPWARVLSYSSQEEFMAAATAQGGVLLSAYTAVVTTMHVGHGDGRDICRTIAQILHPDPGPVMVAALPRRPLTTEAVARQQWGFHAVLRMPCTRASAHAALRRALVVAVEHAMDSS